jgi:hypothetical protein
LDDWSPFESGPEFELANFLYRKDQMSGRKIDDLMLILTKLYEQDPPFANHKELYDVIDSIEKGDAPWDSFSLSYKGPASDDSGEEERPTWMESEYEVWFRDPDTILTQQLANPEFKGQVDYAPMQVYDAKTDERMYDDMMTGDWCWREAVSAMNYFI